MDPFVANVTNFLAYLIVLADILAVALFIILATPLKNRGGGKKLAAFFGDNAIWLSFIVTAGSVIGSLFYSNFAGFVPCLLCWWIRILIYPQAVILLVAIIAKTSDVRKYCLALSWIGLAVSAYDTYLQFGGPAIGDCGVTGVSCEHVYFLEYGYVTIPTMALTAFALILLFMWAGKKSR
jgi:disulfide bond formation protein DsbB